MVSAKVKVINPMGMHKCSGDNEEECLKAAVALVESGLGE